MLLKEITEGAKKILGYVQDAKAKFIASDVTYLDSISSHFDPGLSVAACKWPWPQVICICTALTLLELLDGKQDVPPYLIKKMFPITLNEELLKRCSTLG